MQDMLYLTGNKMRYSGGHSWQQKQDNRFNYCAFKCRTPSRLFSWLFLRLFLHLILRYFWHSVQFYHLHFRKLTISDWASGSILSSSSCNMSFLFLLLILLYVHSMYTLAYRICFKLVYCKVTDLLFFSYSRWNLLGTAVLTDSEINGIKL